MKRSDQKVTQAFQPVLERPKAGLGARCMGALSRSAALQHRLESLCHFLVALLLLVCARATEPDTFSPVVSYQFQESLETSPAPAPIVSSVVSYQYLDWIGDENVTFQSSPSVSYYFSGGVSLSVSGTVRTSANVPVQGATVMLKRYGAAFWTGTSAADGTFAAANVQAAPFIVTATKTGYVTAISNHNGTAGGSQTLNVVLNPLPAAPVATAVNRSLTGDEVRPAPSPSDPDAPVLLRYNGSQLVADLTGLNPARMTVVISHGWVPKLDASSMATALNWATLLASEIHQRHPGLSQPPNIVVWDWRQKAHTDLPEVDRAAEQGEVLGAAMQDALGAGYSQHVHFIGHSLGTIVNRYACDYLHGSLRSGNPSVRWEPSLTSPHVTLLDEAEVATLLGQKVITAGEYGWKVANLLRTNVVGGVIASGTAGAIVAKLNWKYPIPKDALWVDNYVSAFGLIRDEAVNVCLLTPTVSLQTQAWNVDGLTSAHAYAHEWYRRSVNPAGASSAPPAVGYGRSLESAGIGFFPPTGAGLANGSLWFENLSTTGDILDLTRNRGDLGVLGVLVGTGDMPIFIAATVPLATTAAQVGNNLFYKPLDSLGRSVLDGYDSSIEWAGDIGGTVIYKTGVVITETKEKVGLWWDAAMDKASNVLNSINPETQLAGPLTRGVFGLRLQTQPPAPAQNGLAASGRQPAYAWVTVTVPPNAGLMAFDFTVTGDPVDDRIACAVNGQNVFTLPAKFAAAGEVMSTDMMDVSAFAGQSIEVFFGLVGGTSTCCEVAIDGLRFITVPTPKIGIGFAGGGAEVKWPAAASGWVLEATDSLTTPNWQPVPMTGVALDQGVATVAQPINAAARFYRLRRSP